MNTSVEFKNPPDSNNKKCLHVACRCIAAENNEYCGAYCENASDKYQEGDGCGCNHSACGNDE